jgi:tape measure domain-containing protein
MAATDLERLVVQLSADIKKYENSLNRAMGVTNQRARQIETRFAKMGRTINNGAAAAAIGVGKAFAVIGGAQGLKSLSDSATSVDNALKVAGLSGQELERVYRSLYDAAIENAAPIETLVGLYSRLSLVQNELGVSSQQIEGFARNVSLALRVGGTSATEASGALLQLSQAMGAGVVRAEEFSSILEGAPTILQAAAAGIKEADGSVAKLRQIMLDGNLSSRAFFDGFQAGVPLLEQKVAGSVLTIDSRISNLRTTLIDAAREFNQSAKAGETFGNAIDDIAQIVNSVDFDSLISGLQQVTAEMDAGINRATTFLQKLGEILTYDRVGNGLVKLLPGDGAQKSFFGGGLTITSTKGITDRINQAFEGQIEQAGKLTSEAIKNSVLGKGAAGPVQTTDKGARLPAAPTQITLTDPKYKVADTGSGSKKGKGGSGGGANDYQREIEQIKERTAALQAETAAMSQVNPLVNDYGFALAKARAESDLLAAAQKEGMAITPALKESIDQLATGYANASVAAEKLTESQDHARDTANEFKDMSKDIASGFISDLRSGVSAADALSNALNKVLDKVIDIGLNSLFGTGGAGGGGFLGGLFSLFGFAKGGIAAHGKPVKTFARGGVSNRAAIFGEAGPEAAVPLPDGRSIPVKFQTPAVPKRASGGAASTYAPTYHIDARGADQAAVARLERGLAERDATESKRAAGYRQKSEVRKVRP